jgi:hypothetical protein
MKILVLAIVLAVSACSPRNKLSEQPAQETQATNSLPSDAEIQQKMTGTWLIDKSYMKSMLTIASNGGYVCHLTHGGTCQLEGKFQVRDGILIDTITKSSITSEPVPINFTNQIIRVNDHELVWKENSGGTPIWRKVEK